MATTSQVRSTTATAKSTGTHHFLGGILWYVVVSVLGILFMGPFLWTVGSSLKGPTDLYVYPPELLPPTLIWHNYAAIWTFVPLLEFIQNSLVAGVLTTIGQTLSAAAVGYGFARFKFPGRGVLFILLMSTLIVPPQVMMVPRFLLYKDIGWLDSLLPLWVPAWFGGSAFFIFLMRQFFMTIPRELDDAAEIDGASGVQIFWHILMPLTLPAVATVAIFAFLWNWNDFLSPLIYLTSEHNFTLPLGLRFFQQEAGTGGEPHEQLLMAASIIDTLPPIALFFALQRYFVRGIVMGGIKG
ncbi:MAG TPA: carbohydrate ABC transporter permease [Chloroflexota bacterium]|nr:carbohydrate ABC transporter permease [Chloroflexota bacterium]